ncbi:MAG: nucleotidyltransferase domain-containing protein [Anaerolineales bacterium]
MYNTNMDLKKLSAILENIQIELLRLFGDQLEGVYLYGSHARGDAHTDSDIDVLVVLRKEFDYFELLERTSDLFWKLSLENDIVISRVFISREQFYRPDTPFLVNVQREAKPV